MKRILVTGAAGKLGHDVCAAAVGRYEVVGFDRVATDVEGIEKVVGDVRDLAQVTKAAEGCCAIVHTAALLDRFIKDHPRDEFIAINVAGVDNIYQAALANGIKKVVYSSSGEVYGTDWQDWGGQVVEEDATPARPVTIYGLTKYLGEHVGHCYARNHGIAVANLRYMTFDASPRQRLGMLLMARYADCRDYSEANLAAVESDRIVDDQINIGPLTPLTQHDVIAGMIKPEETLEKFFPGANDLLARARTLQGKVPGNEYFHERARLTPGANYMYPVGSIKKALRLLDWKPKYTFSVWLEELKAELKKLGA
jgi:nucleoside-diphosphate-sugar epimerase